MTQPTVVVVDDHALFRAGVRTELEGVLEVLGDAASVGDAVRLVLERKPDVVLLDVHMPGGGGVEVIRQVAATRPGQRFLALSVSDAAEDVIAIVRAGARGYVTKTISGEELADAVRRVHDGDAVFSPRLAGFVLDAFAGAPVPAVAAAPAPRGGEELADAIRRVADGDAVFSPRLAGFVLDAFADGAAPATDPDLDQLTAREREVLRHIARGYAYKEVARQLGLSVKSIETHVSSVLRKLQLSSRYELSRWATDRRIV